MTVEHLYFLFLFLCPQTIPIATDRPRNKYVQKHEDWATLVSHAELIYDQYASSSVVRELRRKRKTSTGDKVTEGDMVFLRDGLISCEFTDAVKGGDSGKVVLVLKIWALSF